MYPYYILIVLSVLLFFYGFFPTSKTTEKFDNEPPTHINNITLNQDYLYSSEIDKTVLLIIDALRVDFIDPHYMPKTSQLVKENGCFNTVKVETPTVTLPRIKALIAGKIPQFIDLVLNLASSEVLEDSLIHSAYNRQKNIVFYGDETWLKLFKNVFIRHEGTSSFFVRDFTEVDDNVTRNVNFELGREDWDFMILHYLGLDHIGHVYGPRSSLVPEKLREMDEIIYKIYSEVKSNKKLLVITGDHGMKDSGGHGGSTYSETHVPLLMLGHQCSNGSFAQTDIPVNLAVLLGLNIPSASIGQLRENLLPYTLEKYLFCLRYNALLLMQKSSLCQDYFDLATKFHEMHVHNFDQASALTAIEFYKKCSNEISDNLMHSSVKQNLCSLAVAILVMFNLLSLLVNKLMGIAKRKIQSKRTDSLVIRRYFVLLVMTLTHFVLVNYLVTYLCIAVLVIILITNIMPILKHKYDVLHDTSIFLMIFSIIHPLTFVSSSFVEEEHQFWYYFNNLFLLINIVSFIKTNNIKYFLQWLVLLVAIRFFRTLNSTGDKWANYPDISDWLLQEGNNIYYQLFFIFGLLTVLYSQYILTDNSNKFKATLFNSITLLLIFIFKNITYNIILGKLIWLLIVSHVFIFRDYTQAWILISTLLLKPYNIILISCCIYASLAYSLQFNDTAIITLSHAWLGNMLYFAQGHSNSLASVDISVGYVGLSDYQPVLVIAQVLSHTYSLPILCHFLIFMKNDINKDKVWEILICNRLFITVVICIITLILRHHLFIWSVFAPKLFIESIHTVILFIEVSMYYSHKKIKTRFCRFHKYFFKYN